VTFQDGTPLASDDARQSPRATVAWRARVVTGPTSYEDVRVINISFEGLAFLCSLALPAGSSQLLAIAIPDPKDRSHYLYVTAQVRVMHHIISGDKFRIGARLAQADAHTRQLIEHWVRKGG
jgi:hypothetical protein